MNLLFLSLLTLSSFANENYGNELFCDLVDKPNSSTLKISYDEDQDPIAVALRSPGEKNFRKLNASIAALIKNEEHGMVSFSVVPNNIPQIDWEQQGECYVEVGTQWYFMFNRKKDTFVVQFLPYLIKEYETCITPRFRPQNNELACTAN